MKIQSAVFALCLSLFTIAIGGLPFQAVAQEKKEEAQTHYSHKSSKGKTYYLFSREQKLKNSEKVITMYYFAKDPNNTKGKPVAVVPSDREVSETKNGLLVLKKKK